MRGGKGLCKGHQFLGKSTPAKGGRAKQAGGLKQFQANNRNQDAGDPDTKELWRRGRQNIGHRQIAACQHRENFVER